MDSLERTLAEIRSKAAELRNSFGDEEGARAIEWAASLVERALQEHAEERLTRRGISEVRLFPGPPGQTHPGKDGRSHPVDAAVVTP